MLTVDAILKSEQLPSLPEVAVRIVELAGRPEPDIPALVETIKLDPAICGRIMRVTNSALFGLRQRVETIEAAVPILGISLVRTLVLGFALARQVDRQGALQAAYQRVWRACVTQAVAAEAAAEILPGADGPTYFLAGLLQDVGVLGMLQAAPDVYAPLVLECEGFPEIETLELAKLGLSHVEVSVSLCEEWGLGTTFTQPIGEHHQDWKPNAKGPTDALTRALRFASVCAQFIEAAQTKGRAESQSLQRLLKEEYQLSGQDAEEFLGEICLRVGEVAASFLIDIGSLPSHGEILERANRALRDIAIQSQLETRNATQQAHQAQSRLQSLEAERTELQTHAFRDALTGVYNRGFMANVLDLEVERCESSGNLLGFLFLDVDKFKGLNDNHGHACGDEALKQLAEVLKQSVRERDVVIRYGGDEFLVILIDVTQQEVETIANRICRRVRCVRLGEEGAVRMTTSVGAMLYTPAAGDQVESDQLIEEVDRAMYLAKQRGGDCCELLRFGA